MSFVEIILLAIGLATDASCVCASNALVYRPRLNSKIKMSLTCAMFQFIMPVIGYLGAVNLPKSIYQYNNLIACILLCFIGGKMIIEAYKDSHKKRVVSSTNEKNDITYKTLILQGVATSIDALSVGFAFSKLIFIEVISSSIIISIITFTMCFLFVNIGGFIGEKLNAKTELLGGLILIVLAIKMLF